MPARRRLGPALGRREHDPGPRSRRRRTVPDAPSSAVPRTRASRPVAPLPQGSRQRRESGASAAVPTAPVDRAPCDARAASPPWRRCLIDRADWSSPTSSGRRERTASAAPVRFAAVSTSPVEARRLGAGLQARVRTPGVSRPPPRGARAAMRSRPLLRPSSASARARFRRRRRRRRLAARAPLTLRC